MRLYTKEHLERVADVGVMRLDEDAIEWLPSEQAYLAQGLECFALVGYDEDDEVVAVLGHDGGEPEDQLLVRDWRWVTQLVTDLLFSRQQVRASSGHRIVGFRVIE